MRELVAPPAPFEAVAILLVAVGVLFGFDLLAGRRS